MALLEPVGQSLHRRVPVGCLGHAQGASSDNQENVSKLFCQSVPLLSLFLQLQSTRLSRATNKILDFRFLFGVRFLFFRSLTNIRLHLGVSNRLRFIHIYNSKINSTYYNQF